EQIEIVERLQKAECVAPADENRFRIVNLCAATNLCYLKSHTSEALADSCSVSITIEERERDEGNALHGAEECADLWLGMIEIAVTVNDGRRDEQQSHNLLSEQTRGRPRPAALCALRVGKFCDQPEERADAFHASRVFERRFDRENVPAESLENRR